MKRSHLINVLAAALIFFAPHAGFGDERIGNLVFNAMQKIQDNHKSFLTEVRSIKETRKTGTYEREIAKQNFEKSKKDTLDRNQFHAEFCYAQAKVYRALYDEVKLTNDISAKQLDVLNALKDSIESGEADISPQSAVAILDASKPFLENGRTLMASLALNRDRITDPVINSKLNSAYETAQMLSNYLNHVEKNRLNQNMQEAALRQKVSELINQLNSLYAQTDILMAMIKDKTTVLKMVNELAAAELGMGALTEGKYMISQISEEIIKPLVDEYKMADEDLNILTSEVLEGDGSFNSGVSQQWTNVKF